MANSVDPDQTASEMANNVVPDKTASEIANNVVPDQTVSEMASSVDPDQTASKMANSVDPDLTAFFKSSLTLVNTVYPDPSRQQLNAHQGSIMMTEIDKFALTSQ